MLGPISNHDVSQSNFYYNVTEQIFDRPLDPSQQESVRSSMRSQVSVLSSDSAKIRMQRKQTILETNSIEAAL